MKLYIQLLLGCLCSCGSTLAQNKGNYTFIGELQYNKNAYLNYKEIRSIPFRFFFDKYTLVCTGIDSKVPVKASIVPKETYYDQPGQVVELRMVIPAAAFAGSNSMHLLGRIMRKSDNSPVGATELIEIVVPGNDDPAYINASTFKLRSPVKVGAPAEVSVATIVDYLKEHLTNTSDTNEYPAIVRSLGINGTSGGKARFSSRDYYKLIEFIEPYITNQSFLVQEAQELHDSLSRILYSVKDSNIANAAPDVRLRYTHTRQVYEDYCSFNADLIRYYIEAQRRIARDIAFWLEVGANVNPSLDDVSINGLYFGGFFNVHKASYIYPYKLPELDVLAAGNPVLVGKYREIRKTNRKLNWSLPIGVYSSSIMVNDASVDFSRSYYSITSSVPLRDTLYRVYRDSGAVRLSEQLQYVSAFVCPQLSIFQKTSGSTRTGFGIGLHAEYQLQMYKLNRDISKLSRVDTATISKAQAASTYGDSIGTTLEQRVDRNTFYFGIEFPFSYSGRALGLGIIPAVGFTNQISILEAASIADNSSFKPYASLSLSIDERKFGLGLRGEIRTFIGEETLPFVSVTIIKKFNAAALLKSVIVFNK